MKIAVRGGHNFQAVGSNGIIDETTEDRKVKDSVIKYLNQLGHTVLDVTPNDMDTNSDLFYGVNKANNWDADLFISIHFNKAYSYYNGAIGTEAWIYSKSDNIKLDEEVALRIVNNVAALGFTNRGIKESIDLYELKSSKMAAVIVEVCFVEATEDVALYKKLGSDTVGKTIAEAIADKKIINKTTINDFSYSGNLFAGNIIKMHVITNNVSEHKFIIRNPKGEWIVLKDYAPEATYDYAFQEEGQYRLVVHARAQGSNSEYDDYKFIDVNVERAKAKNIDVTVNYKEGSINFGVEAEKDLLYKLIVGDRTTGEWKTIEEYSSKSNAEYSPNNNGLHRFVVHVKNKSSINEYDDYSFLDINIRL